jgi:hypothetical protein
MGPTPIKNAAGAIKGTNTALKYGGPTGKLSEVQRVHEKRVERAEQN